MPPFAGALVDKRASFMPGQPSVQLLVLMRAINLVDMPESMLLTHLESFIEVARTGNVSRAAQALFLTQPALTARLSSTVAPCSSTIEVVPSAHGITKDTLAWGVGVPAPAVLKRSSGFPALPHQGERGSDRTGCVRASVPPREGWLG